MIMPFDIAPVVEILIETPRTKVSCCRPISPSKSGVGTYEKTPALLSKHLITSLLCEDLQAYHGVLEYVEFHIG